MKTLSALIICVALSGCAGLSVNWVMNATYTSDVPLGARAK